MNEMAVSDYKGVFIFAQQVDNKITGVSYELIGKGKQLAADLGDEVTAVLLGHQVTDLAKKLARYGADRVIVVDDPALETYMTEPYVEAMYEVIQAKKPAVVLYGATAIGRDMAPRVSARVHTGLTADCTGLEIDPETKNLMMTRPAFGGNIMATILCPDHRPQMATVRPGVMQRISPIDGAECPVEKFEVPNLDSRKNVEILEVIKKVSEKMDIQDAKVLVSGGRGMGCPDNFKLLEELADEPAPASTPAGSRRTARSARRARPSARTCTSPAASPAPSSISPAWRRATSSSPSTRTPPPRSSRSRITAWSATSARSCPSSPRRFAACAPRRRTPDFSRESKGAPSVRKGLPFLRGGGKPRGRGRARANARFGRFFFAGRFSSAWKGRQVAETEL